MSRRLELLIAACLYYSGLVKLARWLTQYEVSDCRVVLEKQLGRPARTFAYPVGKREHIGENGLYAVQAAKYDWALTTIHGLNTPQTDPHLLQRIVVDVDQHWLMVAAKASGAWDFFTDLCRMPITLMSKQAKLRTLRGKGDQG